MKNFLTCVIICSKIKKNFFFKLYKRYLTALAEILEDFVSKFWAYYKKSKAQNNIFYY